MLRVAASQLAPYLKVGVLPEACKVACQLHRLESRREKFHKKRTPSTVNAWRGVHAKAFLKAYAKYRNLGTLTVVDAYLAARRHLNVRRSNLVNLSAVRMG